MLYYYVPNGFRWFADIAACLVSYFVLLLKRDLRGHRRAGKDAYQSLYSSSLCLDRRVCSGIFGGSWLCSEDRYNILKHILFSCLGINSQCAKSNTDHFALLPVVEDLECNGA